MKTTAIRFRYATKLFLSHLLAVFLVSGSVGTFFYVRAMDNLMRSLQSRLQNSAAPYCCSRCLAWPGLVAGCVLAFAKALGEFGATITFVSNIPGETQTLSSAIYGLMQVPGGEAGIWRLAAVAVAISLAALLFSEWLVRRHPTRHGEDG